MSKLNIVMVEPEIPQNTGNIVRTCAAIGARLHLVRPLGFSTSEKAVKRAGLDYWHLVDISYYDCLQEFFDKTEGKYYYFSTKAKHIHTEVEYEGEVYLLFGKESAGLPEELLVKNKETTVRIPMIEEARSLNLSNSVAIAAYEVLRQWNYEELRTTGELHRLQWD